MDYDREGKNNFYFLAGDQIRPLLACCFAATGCTGADALNVVGS